MSEKHDHQWMIYGAYGYTGDLAAREAVRIGLKPVLAGRREEPLKALAEELKLQWRCFDLNEDFHSQLNDMKLVLHCAGPFSETSKPMLDACLLTSSHYLDITGEIDVFKACHGRDIEAKAADIVVIPGTGFDVVPSDCLAATLKAQLPQASSLQLAFAAGGGPSRGTAKSSVEGLGKGGRIRRDGELKTVPLAYKSRDIEFDDKTRHAVTIPWGDVFTAYISTEIPNIEVYMAVPEASVRKLKMLRWVQPLFKFKPVTNFMKSKIDSGKAGPSAEKRELTSSHLWGKASTADESVEGTLVTPNGYALTATTSVDIARYLLNNQVKPGYATPSMLMGADYITKFAGVKMTVGEVSASNS